MSFEHKMRIEWKQKIIIQEHYNLTGKTKAIESRV